MFTINNLKSIQHMRHLNLHRLFAILALAVASLSVNSRASVLTLTNDEVAATWQGHGNTMWPDSVQDMKTGQTLAIKGDLFDLVLTNGNYVRSSDFKLVGSVQTEPLDINPGASRFAE